MISSAKFTIAKSTLYKELSNINKIIGKKRRYKTTLEITIIDDYIILVVPGISIKLSAVTESTAKFSLGLLYFIHVVKTHRFDDMQFLIKDTMITLGSLSFKVRSTFFETDQILRSVDLPINYENVHLMRMEQSGRYTQSEISFNKLDGYKSKAYQKLEKDIDKITAIAHAYGFSRAEIETFMYARIQNFN
jgi:hypothetical protein